MKYLSRRDLEAIAARVVRAYWRIPNAQNEPSRIVPEVLLTEMLGLTIDYRHLSKNRQMLGMTCFSETGVEVFDSPLEDFFFLDGKSVLIEEDLKNPTAVPGRRNFTIMHEGCHHVLYMLFPEDYREGISARRVLVYRDTGNNAAYDYWVEWQTDTLASAILMPPDLLRTNMALCGIPSGVSILNQRWRPREYEKFTLLSEMMGVSKQALSIRLKQFGLIGRDDRSYPNSLLDIFKEDDEID